MPNRGRFMEWTARIAARYRGADAATTNVEGAHQRPGSAADACRSCFALPCLRDVRRVRGRGRCDPHRLRSRRYRPRRYRPPSSCAAPAVPRGGGQRTGAGMRPDHRRLETAAHGAALGQTARQGALTLPGPGQAFRRACAARFQPTPFSSTYPLPSEREHATDGKGQHREVAYSPRRPGWPAPAWRSCRPAAAGGGTLQPARPPDHRLPARSTTANGPVMTDRFRFQSDCRSRRWMILGAAAPPPGGLPWI
jgi:hypothetical protein